MRIWPRYSCWYSPLIWVHTTGLLGSTLCFDFKELKGYKIPVWLILEWVHPISAYVYFSVFVYMTPKQHFIPVQDILEWVHSKNCVVWRKWNHASENTLQSKPFDFIMWMQYKLHSGMKLMNKLWNESHSSIILMAPKCHFVKYQLFLFVLF